MNMSGHVGRWWTLDGSYVRCRQQMESCHGHVWTCTQLKGGGASLNMQSLHNHDQHALRDYKTATSVPILPILNYISPPLTTLEIPAVPWKCICPDARNCLMAQAQLDARCVTQSKQFLIAISPDFSLKIRQISGKTLVLFYYKNKKSFSIPIDLFMQISDNLETIQVAAGLLQGNLFGLNHGLVHSSGIGCDTSEHCE